MASKISQIGQFIFALSNNPRNRRFFLLCFPNFSWRKRYSSHRISGIYYASRPSAELVPRNVQLPAHLSLNSPLRLVRFDHVVSITVNVDNSVM